MDMDLKKCNRIMVVGSPGSGKSWLSRQLAEQTGLPLTHLDMEYWRPDWVETPKDEWRSKHREMLREEEWIIDGNYGSTMEERWQAADAVILMDTSRWTCVWRVLRRHGNKRPDLPQYLEEKLDREFLDFLRYIWSFPLKKRPSILTLKAKYPDKAFEVLRNRRDVRRFLGEVESRR